MRREVTTGEITTEEITTGEITRRDREGETPTATSASHRFRDLPDHEDDPQAVPTVWGKKEVQDRQAAGPSSSLLTSGKERRAPCLLCSADLTCGGLSLSSDARVSKQVVLLLTRVATTRQGLTTRRCGRPHHSRAKHVPFHPSKKEQSYSLLPHVTETTVHFRQWRVLGANVVTPAKGPLELPMSSRYRGGTCKESALHRSLRCHSILPIQLPRVELRTSTSFVARQCESFARPHRNDKSDTVHRRKAHPSVQDTSPTFLLCC